MRRSMIKSQTKTTIIAGLILAMSFTALAGQVKETKKVAQKEQPVFTDYAAALISKPPAKLMLDPFYEKYSNAMGIPVIASGQVSDLAVLIARDIIIHMLSERPDLRAQLVLEGQRVGIIGQDQQMSDIPEYKNLKKPQLGDRRLTPSEIAGYERISKLSDAEYWNRRARGLGGLYTTCGEENLLGIPGTRYFGEQILVHEFGHAIHRAIRRADPRLAADIEKAYADAMALGLFKGQYASTNSDEYWAEGTQFWFWSNFEYKDGEKVVYSPAELRSYDPALYELLSRVYPGSHHLPLDPFWNFKTGLGAITSKP